jgi:predicted sulfurtransferase
MPVLLFYWYCELADPALLVEQQRALCSRVGLTGRVRVATEGINATLGGSAAGCAEYEQALTADPRFAGVDIKRSEGGSADFEGLLVKEGKEIVTLGIAPEALSFKDGGAHLSPAEFRQELLGKSDGSPSGDSSGPVVIDCRNAYESRIGCFNDALTPPTRQFSDFPAWCRENRSALEGRRVLMYCTGGIRCERASAYVLGSDVKAATVGQLHGGIHRFLEEWPDGGGVWQGKNLVFDKRTAMGTSPPSRVAHAVCDLCDAKECDDYSAGARCRYCRARLLACLSCTAALQSGRASADGHLCRECITSAGEGKLKKRAAIGRDCWPHLREAGLGPPATAKAATAAEPGRKKASRKGPKTGGRRKIRLKYLHAMSSVMNHARMNTVEPEPEPQQEQSAGLECGEEAPCPPQLLQLSGSDAVDSALLCFFLLQPNQSDANDDDGVVRTAWQALLDAQQRASGRGCGKLGAGSHDDCLQSAALQEIPPEESAEAAEEAEEDIRMQAAAEDAIDQFAATAAPSSGCAILLWREPAMDTVTAEAAADGEEQLAAAASADAISAPVDADCSDFDAAPPPSRKVLEGGAGCLALWKETDGRTIHRLYPADNDDADSPLLGVDAARRVVQMLRQRWGGRLGSRAGERYEGAGPKRQVQRLVQEIRRR